jgi:5,10-methylenetetrahydrofolate reductase
VLLTQPPFDAERWEQWLEDVRRRGVSSQARILMGLPMIRYVYGLKGMPEIR